MNVLIIEDEAPASTRLGKMIQSLLPGSHGAGVLTGITEAEQWFATHPQPDLVFIDIHLADGSAFELLRRVHIAAPLIFTTAYDQYAIEAFKTKSIDYLLKPIRKEELSAALDKLAALRGTPGAAPLTLAPPAGNAAYKERFVIRIGEQLKTLAASEIAYCYAEHKVVFARCTSGRNYPMDHNLDALEHLLDRKHFFRINRQYLISLQAIQEMRAYTKSRIVIRLKPECKEAPVVSSERSADFKLWLGGEL
jgi:DNA-binding LytR/AlgR family response regulator